MTNECHACGAKELLWLATDGRWYCRPCHDSADYFTAPPEQRTLYQEGTCRPGWISPIPEAPAAPLYTPKGWHGLEGDEAMIQAIAASSIDSVGLPNGEALRFIEEILPEGGDQ